LGISESAAAGVTNDPVTPTMSKPKTK